MVSPGVLGGRVHRAPWGAPECVRAGVPVVTRAVLHAANWGFTTPAAGGDDKEPIGNRPSQT